MQTCSAKVNWLSACEPCLAGPGEIETASCRPLFAATWVCWSQAAICKKIYKDCQPYLCRPVRAHFRATVPVQHLHKWLWQIQPSRLISHTVTGAYVAGNPSQQHAATVPVGSSNSMHHISTQAKWGGGPTLATQVQGGLSILLPPVWWGISFYIIVWDDKPHNAGVAVTWRWFQFSHNFLSLRFLI